MSKSREVDFLVIERSKKLTFSLVSGFGLSLMLPWIVSMQCCMLVAEVSVESQIISISSTYLA
jgi:hypothetical protein